MAHRIHIVGRKDHGKTTLVVDLVRGLTERGLRVGTIKHTHHHHELDTPGKDSHQHRVAGAAAVGICSPMMHAIFWPQDHPGPDATKYDRFSAMADACDWIIVEGDSQTTERKIEVWRESVGTTPLAASDASVLAVVSDDAAPVDVPIWGRSDVEGICQRLLDLVSVARAPDGNGIDSI